jgi:TRAP-type uncharacterized transport system substrate-binding protein
VEGRTDAIFDEGADEWLDAALASGLKALPLRESTVARLEKLGYRRGVLDRARFPSLPNDVATIDFSGWPIFVHSDLPDARVRAVCEALEQRFSRIPVEGSRPAEIERMCRDTPEGPHMIPLHSAAERFWRARGYI